MRSTALGSHFHVNTFCVDAYADALPGRPHVALAMPLDRRQEMPYWLYWRAYELFAGKDDFQDLFEGAELDDVFSAPASRRSGPLGSCVGRTRATT